MQHELRTLDGKIGDAYRSIESGDNPLKLLEEASEMLGTMRLFAPWAYESLKRAAAIVESDVCLMRQRGRDYHPLARALTHINAVLDEQDQVWGDDELREQMRPFLDELQEAA